MDVWNVGGVDDDFNFPADPADLQAADAPLLQADGQALGADTACLPFHLLVKLPTNQLPRTVLPRAPTFALGHAANGLLSARASLRSAMLSSDQKKPTQPASSTATDAENPPSTAAAEAAATRYVGGSRRNGWSTAQTNEFFDALSQFGTDFSSIAVLFPGKSRLEILHKYKAEMRNNAEKVLQALAAQKPIDVDRFVQFKRQAEAANEEPARKLNDDELVFLRGLEDIAPPTAPKQEGAAAAAGADDFSFDEDAPLLELYSPLEAKESVPLSVLYSHQEEDKQKNSRATKKKTPASPAGAVERARPKKKLRAEIALQEEPKALLMDSSPFEVDFEFE